MAIKVRADARSSLTIAQQAAIRARTGSGVSLGIPALVTDRDGVVFAVYDDPRLPKEDISGKTWADVLNDREEVIVKVERTGPVGPTKE